MPFRPARALPRQARALQCSLALSLSGMRIVPQLYEDRPERYEDCQKSPWYEGGQCGPWYEGGWREASNERGPSNEDLATAPSRQERL